MMFYTKNVPVWERVLRTIVGVGMIGYGLFGMKEAQIWGYVIALTGVVALVTGSVGFCPMCALAGRKIARKIASGNDGGHK